MKRSGAALVVTIIILGVVVITGAATSIMIGRDIYTARRLRESTQAYFLAEAGIEESIQDLYDNRFNFNNFPKNKTLGSGSFNAVLNTTKYASDRLVKITSAGTVGEVTRTISATVKDARIPSFTYAVLSGGKMWIAGYSDVDYSIHSNNSSQSMIDPALRVGGILITTATIHGNATACGSVNNKNLFGVVTGFVTGTLAGDQPSVTMPPFDDAFWNYYYQLALASDNVYNGTKKFTSNPNPANGVIWVNGEVRLQGTWTLTGCIIATGPIIVNGWTSGTITQVPKAGEPYSRFPALMSKNSYIKIWDPTIVNGLIYAGADISIFSIDRPRSFTINGSVMCNSYLTMFYTDLNYVAPNPPGLTTPAPLTVVCWGS